MSFAATTGAICLTVVSMAVAADAWSAIKHPTHLEAQGLGAALQELALEHRLQILYRSELVESVRTERIDGDLTSDEALRNLLSGTGLTYRYLDEKAVTIEPAPEAAAGAGVAPAPATGPAADASSTGNGARGQLRFAQAAREEGTDLTMGKQSETEPSDTSRLPRLEEVLVTGSRLAPQSKDGAQDVKVYGQQQIEASGQTTVTGFLNTLPDVSISLGESRMQNGLGSTTAQLHGLPVGTTLVLINGRRLENSGASTFFDLNNLPAAAVERVEVLSTGSSAVYGSDAIAGVINIVLKTKLDGFEANLKYGGASGTDETDASAAFGKQWSRGGFMVLGTYQDRTELAGFERAITSTDNHVAQGGIDVRGYTCNPGNVFSTTGANLPGVGARNAGVPAGYTGTPSQQEFAATAGLLNKCSNTQPSDSILPQSRRTGLTASGSYRLTSWAEAFAELMLSRVDQSFFSSTLGISGSPTSASHVVPADNPYNPFGVPVGVSNLFTSLGRNPVTYDTTTYRPVLGLRGEFLSDWRWEAAAWMSRDRSDYSAYTTNAGAITNALNSTDPATALNPFVDGPAGSQQLLRSLETNLKYMYAGETRAANAFLSGPLLQLPGGALRIAFGGEYFRDEVETLYLNSPVYPPNTYETYSRDTRAVFGEARVPLLGSAGGELPGDRLAVTVAGRYDAYAQFGGKTTPQFGLEWRPLPSLLARATYGKSFKAPYLNYLYGARTTFAFSVIDPKNGNRVETANATAGGNPDLLPESGQSRTFGLLYTSKVVPGFTLDVTRWSIDLSNSFQTLNPQTIVNNESLFPGRVTRGANGEITAVDYTYTNFGALRTSGFDYQVGYAHDTALGRFSPAIAVTQTTRYEAALVPGGMPTNRDSRAMDDGNFAPRWKGTVSLGWKLGSYSVNLSGRFTGSYQDYDRSAMIGDFWLFDANLRYGLGEALAAGNRWAHGLYIAAGGINLFNRLPQYSNFDGGYAAYDPAEGDIVGRYLYTQIGVKW